MDYIAIYKRLIDKHRGAVKHPGVYLEKHHIMPDFFYVNRKRKGPIGILPGDPDCPNNIVYMPPRDHLVAHLLLARIYKGTRFEYGCIASLIMMLNISAIQHGRLAVKDFFARSRTYEQLKCRWNKKVSDRFKGTIVAKDMNTGQIIGHVKTNHPKIISGEWAHHSKGTRLSNDHREKISKTTRGLSNGNSHGYTDNDLLLSYIECANAIGFIPHSKIWFGWAQKNNKPYIKSFRKFRFNGGGFLKMRKLAEDKTGMEYNAKLYIRKNTKDLYKKAKQLWA